MTFLAPSMLQSLQSLKNKRLVGNQYSKIIWQINNVRTISYTSIKLNEKRDIPNNNINTISSRDKLEQIRKTSNLMKWSKKDNLILPAKRIEHDYNIKKQEKVETKEQESEGELFSFSMPEPEPIKKEVPVKPNNKNEVFKPKFNNPMKYVRKDTINKEQAIVEQVAIIDKEKEEARKKHLAKNISLKNKEEVNKKKDKKTSHRKEIEEEIDLTSIKVKTKPKPRVKLPIKIRDVYLPPFIKLANLSKILNVNYNLMRKKMLESGLPDHPYDYLINFDDASLIAMSFNLNPIQDSIQSKDIYPIEEDNKSNLPIRSPVVTIMGHVDHGKTTLLDTLRKSSVAAGEAGGITQHVGAFKVKLKNGQSITFLDTPGHAAFKNMRARGAHVTDIVVLVIAADDGIMPQTKEAIEHSLEAKVPIIVALTKCDKAHNNLKQIKEDLLNYNIQLEEYGGDTPVVEVAAPLGKGIVELEDTICTLAEVLDLKASLKEPVEATIIESNIDKGLGPIATIIVNRGTLKVGQYFVAGTAWCKVKSLNDENNNKLKSVVPGSPARISGWRSTPMAGDLCLMAKNEDEAKLVINNRLRIIKQSLEFKEMMAINEKRMKEYEMNNIDDEQDIEQETDIPVLPIIIKGDVSGTVEAIEESILQIPNNKVQAKVVLRGVGPVTKADLDVAVASSGLIITFNIKNDKEIIQLAKAKKIEIQSSNIIYNLLEQVKDRMLELIPVKYQFVEMARIQIIKVFSMKLKNRAGLTNIAGCKVISGTLNKNYFIDVYRAPEKNKKLGEKVMHQAEISVLKSFKQDVDNVKSNSECALELYRFDQFNEGDILIAYNRLEEDKVL